jgi:hypothetical protein
MSYDLAILDDNGKPSRYISIGVDEHYRLNCMAKEKEFSLILRMGDYYSDTTYHATEINSLMREISLMIADISPKDSGIRTFLIKALGLADEAITQQKAIEGIAD